ncbi:MAG: tetratricopeptide repeat protein [Clostridiales bacterium]|nr:tetratricopeptide repeat protein [Clostridiales bacterium]
MVKKIAIAVWIITAFFFGILLVNYVANKNLIKKYGQGIYQQNEFGALGFTQPYIDDYNRGNVYFQLGAYQEAKEEYHKALSKNPDDPYDCKIRVNYALTYVLPIEIDKLTDSTYKSALNDIEEAKKILLEKGCATEEDGGHYYAAQKLYNELNQMEQEIKDKFEPPENPTPTPTPTPTPEGSPKPEDNKNPSPTPSPTPTPEGSETPTPTPSGGSETPTPTPTPGGGSETPTPTPGGDSGTPTPTPTPGGDSGTPTPTPGGDSGTPTPTPGGQGTGTPTPTPGGDGQGTPTPTQTPEERIREIQDRANRERYGSGGLGGDDDWNFGNSASW